MADVATDRARDADRAAAAGDARERGKDAHERSAGERGLAAADRESAVQHDVAAAEHEIAAEEHQLSAEEHELSAEEHDIRAAENDATAEDLEHGVIEDREHGAIEDREHGAIEDREHGATDDHEHGVTEDREHGATEGHERGATESAAAAASATTQPLLRLRPPFDWTLRALLAIVLLLLIQHARTFLLPVVVAVVLTLMLAPAVRWLRRFGVSDAVGAALVVLLALSSVGGVAALVSGPAITWWERAPSNLNQLEQAFDRLRESIPFLAPKPTEPAAAKKGATKGAEPPPDPVKERIATEGVSITRALLTQAGTFLVEAAATVVLLYFLLASERWLVARTIQVIPRRRARALVLSAVRTAQREMSYYFGTQLLINAGVGVAVGLACWWLELPGAVLWGAVTAILNFIPYLGPFVAGVLLTIAGVLTFDTFAQALAPMIALVVIHAIEANIVSPLVMSHRLQLSPLALFLSVMLWGWLWGIAGALIAVPVLLTVRIVFHRVRSLRVWASYLDRTQEIDIPSLRALLRPPRTSVTRRLRRRSRESPPGRNAPIVSR